MDTYLLRNIDNPQSARIEEYEASGGYKALRKALVMPAQAIMDEVKRSGLRGRGGAGFPTHMKWSFAFNDPKFPKYLICNADEGEPGTFKDRVLLEQNPHLLIEGMVISALALGSEYGYVYIRGEYPHAYDVMEGALREARDKGYVGADIMGSGRRFELALHRGEGAYICGEETALINSLEGKRGHPRVKPPFPVNAGYVGKPTVVNNVETFCNLPLIISIGADAYAAIGSPQSPGPKLFCVSGHVNRPGLYELPMGTPLREIIYSHAGGIRGGRALKAVIPGGVSTSVLTPDKIDVPMDFVSLPKQGTMLGSGGVIVFDETACMVKAALRIARFFEHESCGKCTPCREGTGWMRALLEKIEAGTAQPADIPLLLDVAGNIEGRTFCALGDGAAIVTMSFVNRFRGEFEAHISAGRCTVSTASPNYD